MADDGSNRTLYIGNLDPSTNEDLLYMLFSKFGVCSDCKIIREIGHDPYAFVRYNEMRDASAALMAMNKRNVLGRELKVNWASSPGSSGKQDTTNHFHVYVGDVSPEIDSAQLRAAFAPFGEISECKVIRDPQTQLSKGFAFVCFVRKDDAENAITTMNGQWLGGRTIRTNWATGKGSTGAPPAKPSRPTLNYEDVYNQASDTNTTVYCGGIQSGLTDELLRQTFSEYGTVEDVRIFKEKCFAFVRLHSKEAAARAIVGVHGQEMNGYQVRCSWGKEVPEPSGVQSPQKVPAPVPSMPQMRPPENGYGVGGQGGYYVPMGYWGYQQGYHPQMQQAMQPGGYMQQQQQPPYNQMNYAQQQGYGGEQGYGFANYGGGGGAMQWPGSNSGYNGQ